MPDHDDNNEKKWYILDGHSLSTLLVELLGVGVHIPRQIHNPLHHLG